MSSELYNAHIMCTMYMSIMSQAAFHVNVKGLLYRVPECLSSRLNWAPPPPPPQASVAPPLELRRLDRHSGTLFSNPFTYVCVFNLHAQNCHLLQGSLKWVTERIFRILYGGNFINEKLKKAANILRAYTKQWTKSIFYCRAPKNICLVRLQSTHTVG